MSPHVGQCLGDAQCGSPVTHIMTGGGDGGGGSGSDGSLSTCYMLGSGLGTGMLP